MVLEKIFKGFLPYMGMAAILFNGVEPFEQIVNIPSTRPIWNLVKIGQAISEKKTVSEKMSKNNMILNMYIAKGQGCITLRGKNFDRN